MKKRETLVEKFSTFLNFNNSSDPPVWKTDSRLANNMSQLCNLEPEIKEEFWAHYWLKKVLQENSNQLALGHISAYLEETCYWIAITKDQKFVSSDFTWIDYLQLARASVAEPARLFAKYDPTRSSLKTYAQLKLGNEIFEMMRMGREKIKYSDAGLLRSLTKKYLEEFLEKAGVIETQQYVLAWNCFKEIYTPTKAAGTQRLKWPDRQQLEVFTDRYNQVRSRYSVKPVITAKKIDLLLKTCVKAVRDCTKPPLDIDKVSFSLKGSDDELKKLESQEENELQQNEWKQLRTILSNKFFALPKDTQKMLELAYGLDIKQTEIGKVFNLKQYQVSRQLDKAKRELLTTLSKWSKQYLEVSLTSQQISKLSEAIDNWLTWYCQSLFHEIFTLTLLQDLKSERQILQFHYEQKLPLTEVATRLSIPESRLKEKLKQVRQCLYSKLEERVQSNLPISLNTLNSAEERITSVVDEWIKNRSYINFKIEGR